MPLFDRVQGIWRRRAKSAAALLNASPPASSTGTAKALAGDPAKKQGQALPLGLAPSASVAAGDPAKFRKDERLSDVMWKPGQEFPGGTTTDATLSSLDRERQILGRVARVSLHSILKPMRLLFLGSCSVGVVGLTSYEAHLLLDPACSLADALAFTYKYSVENFMASCIWETREAELVAQSLGLNPEEVLKALDPKTSPEDAALSLHLHGVYTMRSIVAGFMVITQLLSIVRESMLATKKYVDNIFEGKEPPLRGVTERIIRLAGDGSDVTEVSMARYGAHILPVYENPAKWRHLVKFWSLNGRVPCVWQVSSGGYGYRHSWAKLEVDETYMLRTTTGKFILCIEADATNLDRAHELQKPNNDVTLEEASQAIRMIERAASRKINRPFRSLCVFLGDSLQLCDTGGTAFVTLRERIRIKKEVDVLIDAKAPLLLAILKWCSRFAEKHKTIVLDATPLNYAPLQLLLERNGYKVLTPAEADLWTPPVKPATDTSKAASSNGSSLSSSSSAAAKTATSAPTDSASNAKRTAAQVVSVQPLPMATGVASTGKPLTLSPTSAQPLATDNAPTSDKASAKSGNGKDKDKEKNGDAKDKAADKSSTKPATPEKEKAPPGAKPPTATPTDKREKLPRLIYYPTTAATINAVHSVLTAGLAEPRLCCVLINSPFGMSHLEEISEYEEEEFHPICAAEIYDDYFRLVRIWTRMGHSAAVIQKELDQRFAPVLDIQMEIAQLQRASTTMKKL